MRAIRSNARVRDLVLDQLLCAAVGLWWKGDSRSVLEPGLSGAASALPYIWAFSAQASGDRAGFSSVA